MTTSSYADVSGITFNSGEPIADIGLGGLVRDHFSHGRLFATVGAHGGLLDISYWGNQRLGAAHFFRGDSESGWVKLFRPRVRIADRDYYLTLNETRLFPFGYSSRCEIEGIEFVHELLLLEDALVQRVRIVKNDLDTPVQFEMVHQEEITAITIANRIWRDFEFVQRVNALVTSCRDQNFSKQAEPSLAQAGFKPREVDAPDATTWIGVGCDSPLTVRRGYHPRSKYYLAGRPVKSETAYFIAFAADIHSLESKLSRLEKSVHAECDVLLADYQNRQRNRPKIDVGDPLLNSAFEQYPELVESMKVPDRPGAVRATASGYFVWGWDGMTPIIASALSNEADYAAKILRFFQDTLDPNYGIPHQYSSTFHLTMKGPFPAQCQFIASLYHYVAVTGDLSLARELMPTCKILLDRCRANEVSETGLVSGYALWPDFPEAMEEDGSDISSLNNSLLYQALRSIEFIAGALEDRELASECRHWAQRLRKNFKNYLYDEGLGYFISSCSSITLEPRKHYCCQAVYWITPFARELVSHAPGRIAAFMDEHLRSDKCLLSLPRWDTAWMADGNQLGSSYPTSDYFYLNVHKLIGDGYGLEAWLGDVSWFWKYHTAPEAFTPEAENEAVLGPDNPGCKQLQAVTCWYSCLFMGLAGMDFDHEGITITPWGDRPVAITGLKLRLSVIDIHISGKGSHIGSLLLNGSRLPAGSRKIAWNEITKDRATIEMVRSEQPPVHPVIVRADGLRVLATEVNDAALTATIDGDISGEVVVQSPVGSAVTIDGHSVECAYDEETQTYSIPFDGGERVTIGVKRASLRAQFGQDRL